VFGHPRELAAMNPVFLKAEWRYIAMLNFVVDPAILRPLVPPGTELDSYNGRTYLSVVGFRFMRTQVFGFTFPFHRNFEEVNLRFYVRRRTAEGWRRGVVFVRELVPRRIIAFIARTIYGEAYTAVAMRHKIEVSEFEVRVEYGWRQKGKWERLHISAVGQPKNPAIDSEAEFITEHYWGYTARDQLGEYQVEHPPWRVWQATDAGLEADVCELYGAQFVESLSLPPSSAFIAEGSPITVRCKSDISLAH
jgi:uncharacterized protein